MCSFFNALNINDKEEIRLVKEKSISFEDRVERMNDTKNIYI